MQSQVALSVLKEIVKNIVFIALIATVASCSFFKKKKTHDADVVARVNDEYLYASDLTNITKGLSGADSVAALKSYAESWARKKLLLQKASDNIEDDDQGITKKVEDYRESLLLYEYEKALINQKLDTTFTTQEMNTWYAKMKDDFTLQSDVYRIEFIRIDKGTEDLAKARKWILNPKDEEETEKMKAFFKEFSQTYSLDNAIWYEKEKVLKNFPLNESEVASLASSHRFKEFKEGDMIWFVRISEVLRKDQPSPLEFISDKVEKAIMEKRKMALIDKIYSKIYQDGLNDKNMEIYVK